MEKPESSENQEFKKYLVFELEEGEIADVRFLDEEPKGTQSMAVNFFTLYKFDEVAAKAAFLLGAADGRRPLHEFKNLNVCKPEYYPAYRQGVLVGRSLQEAV